jgi:D-serine deaminase-like pyridoxal phosphate-dependent protein
MTAPFSATAGMNLMQLETPVPVVDVDVVERNLVRWQNRCDALGIANRPHIKTHKLACWARRQMELGAKGITCQKIGEAEVMADAGLDDILITFGILGDAKLARLADLAARVRLTVVADSRAIVEGLAAAGKAAGRPVAVLVECDTGAGRCGVQTPADALALARIVAASEGLRFGGLMTYPAHGGRARMGEFLREAKGLCEASGLSVETVSAGGTPDMRKDDGLDVVTEYRAGTYIYNDRSLVTRGLCSLDDCALWVLATVVSRPTESRAIIDAGSKALTSDLSGQEGYGLLREWPRALVYRLDEEHGYVDLRDTPGPGPKVGDVVSILPNHVCPVSNLYERIVAARGGIVLGSIPVDARGRVS